MAIVEVESTMVTDLSTWFMLVWSNNDFFSAKNALNS